MNPRLLPATAPRGRVPLLLALLALALLLLLLGPDGGQRRPLELAPQLGQLVLGEPRGVGGAAEGLAVGAGGLVQAAVEHVDDLVLEPGHVALAHADDGAGDDLAHVARRLVHLQHVHRLLREDVALQVRQLEGVADELAGLAEEARQRQLVV